MSKQTEAQRLASMLTGHMDAASHAAAAELLRQEALIAELAGALENLIEGADSMLWTCTHHLGETPEDEDVYGHEGWAEKFLSERKEAASAALAKVQQ